MSLDFNPTYTDITHSMLAFYWIIPVEVGPEYVPCLFLKHCVLFCVGGYIHEGDFERPADELDKSPVEGSRVQVVSSHCHQLYILLLDMSVLLYSDKIYG